MKKNEVLDFFAAQLSNEFITVTPEMIKDKQIGKPEDFSRPILIALTKELEEKTGKTILADAPQPMKYLGHTVTIGDISEYFSASSSKRIDAIRRKIFSPFNLNSARKSCKTRTELLSLYAKITGIPIENGLEEKKVMNCRIADLAIDGWKTPILWCHDEADIDADLDASVMRGITPTTTVGEWLNMITK